MTLTKIGSRSFPYQMQSRVDGTSLICISFNNRRAVCWDIARSTNLFDFEFGDNSIIDVMFLDDDFAFAVVTEKHIQIRTNNNFVVCEKQFDHTVTAFHANDDRFYLGFNDGSVVLMKFNRLKCAFDVLLTSETDSSPISTIKSNNGVVTLTTNSKSVYQFV